ncbi:hypothetical protein Tco_0714251 [Tanacetum coccineum]
MKAVAMEMVEVVRLLRLRWQWWLRRLRDEGDDDGAWRCVEGGVGVEREAATGGRKLTGGGGATPKKTARNPSAASIMFLVDLFIIGLQLNHVPKSLPGIIIQFANDLKLLTSVFTMSTIEIEPFGQRYQNANLIAATVDRAPRQLEALIIVGVVYVYKDIDDD